MARLGEVTLFTTEIATAEYLLFDDERNVCRGEIEKSERFQIPTSKTEIVKNVEPATGLVRLVAPQSWRENRNFASFLDL